MTNRESAISRLFSRPLFWVAVIGTLFALPLVRTLLRPEPKLPPVRSRVPETLAGLVRETGEPLSVTTLRGKVWVAARFELDDQKPGARAMLELERHVRKLADAFAMVSIAPPRFGGDSEAVRRMREYALNHRINARRWIFVSGSDAGALLHALELDGPAGSADNELVLVDSELRLRSRYDVGSADPAQEKETRDQLLYDAALLVNHY